MFYWWQRWWYVVFCHINLNRSRFGVRASTSALRPRWAILEWFDIFQLHCVVPRVKPKVIQSVQFGIVRAASLTFYIYMNAMHAIRLGSPLYGAPYILLRNNIFTFFFFFFSFVGPKEMVGFTFHCLFKYSFNLVNASGFWCASAHSRTGPLVRRWRWHRSHST